MRMMPYDVESPQKLSGGPLLTHRSSRYTYDEDLAPPSDVGGDDSTLAKSSRQRSALLKRRAAACTVLLLLLCAFAELVLETAVSPPPGPESTFLRYDEPVCTHRYRTGSPDQLIISN